MNCSTCGCEQVGPAHFCRQCGAALQAAVPPPYPYPYAMQPRMRVRHHVQTLGMMWCVFGTYRIVAGLAGAVAFHLFAHSGAFGDTPPFVSHLVGAMAPLVLLMVVAFGAANVFTGYSLLTRQPWARTLAIVMGVLALIKPPFGTALGIYTLWVLAPQASAVEWDQMTQARTRTQTA